MTQTQTDKHTILLTQIPWNADWTTFVGRLFLRWSDSMDTVFFAVAGTGDPKAALAAAIEDFADELGPIESTDWSNSVTVFRGMTPAQMVASGRFSDEAEARDCIGDTDSAAIDEWAEQVAGKDLILHPGEPMCEDRRKHKWIDGPIRGHGGGVIHHDECQRCGIQRVIDTWATDPCDGSQGHESIAYYHGDGETPIATTAVAA